MAREQVKRKAGAAAAEIGAGVLMRDGARVTDDPWIIVADDETLPADGDLVVSIARLKADGEALLQRKDGELGVLIAPEEAVEDIAAFTARLALVMVHFPSFRDGRGYTTARLLRERFGYRGEVRAVGDVLEDQLFFMMRCGFNSFDLRAIDPEAAFARAQARFTHVYQSAADARAPVCALRAASRRKGAAA